MDGFFAAFSGIFLGVSTLFVYMETKKEFHSCYWTKWQKNVLKDRIGKFYDK